VSRLPGESLTRNRAVWADSCWTTLLSNSLSGCPRAPFPGFFQAQRPIPRGPHSPYIRERGDTHGDNHCSCTGRGLGAANNQSAETGGTWEGDCPRPESEVPHGPWFAEDVSMSSTAGSRLKKLEAFSSATGLNNLPVQKIRDSARQPSVSSRTATAVLRAGIRPEFRNSPHILSPRPSPAGNPGSGDCRPGQRKSSSGRSSSRLVTGPRFRNMP